MPGDETADSALTTSLRQELKRWEKSFAAANGGRKAGRDDIKKDAAISAKYKEYDRLTRKPSRAISTPRKQHASKRLTKGDTILQDCPPNVMSATPTRQRNSGSIQEVENVVNSPKVEQTPAIVRCALGPTPQKDGEILGIFDMLPAATPSKAAGVVTAAPAQAIVSGTPTKITIQAPSESSVSKTPQSSAKRHFLETFAGTPLKRKREEDIRHTPSTAKRQYATPAFLRRSFPLARIDEDADENTVPPPKKRGLVRSLSTIIQGLKKQEEEKMDDEWDIMNEIEAEERGEVVRPKVPKVLVEDSQPAEMPLGPDQGVESEDHADQVDAGALDANGKPRKVWKKKGLKRQTRRVKMRPVTNKNKPVTTAERAESDDEEPKPEADKAVRATLKDVENDDAGGDVDDTDHRHDSQQSPQATGKRETKKLTECTDANRKAKKVKPEAHANFRKLKIKNKNSKANGRGGRLGRR